MANGPHVKAADKAYEDIQGMLVRGEVDLGAHLAEQQLAEQIGVSRTPVREALRRLAADGLVQINPNRGAIVTELSPEEIDEIFGLRALLEPYGASLAARNRDPDQLAKLTELADRMEQLVDGVREGDWAAELTTLNFEFHGEVLKLTGNRRLIEIFRPLVKFPLVRRTFAKYSEGQLRASMGHHREIIDAIQLGDADWASAVMRSHILGAKHVLEPHIVAQSS